MAKFFHLFLYLVILQFICYTCSSSEIVKNSSIEINVDYIPIKSLGYFTLRYLGINSGKRINSSVKFRDSVAEARLMVINDINIDQFVVKSQVIYNTDPSIFKIAELPSVSSNYNEFSKVLDLFDTEQSINYDGSEIYKKIKNKFLEKYPQLKKLSEEESSELSAFISLMKYLYDNNFLKSFSTNSFISAIKYSELFTKHFIPPITLINVDKKISTIQVVLEPAVVNTEQQQVNSGKLSVYSLMPSDNQELEYSQMKAFYDICYSITAPILNNVLSLNKYNNLYYLQQLYINSARQAMYESLIANNSDQLSSFFDSRFGNLSEYLQKTLLNETINPLGKSLDSNEFSELQELYRKNKIEAYRSIFNRGLLVPDELLNKLRETIKANKKSDKQIFVNLTAAEAMMRVFEAIHKKESLIKVNELLFTALQSKAYELSNYDYQSNLLLDKNSVNLESYRDFIYAFARGEYLIGDNKNFQQLLTVYLDVINNPEKYQKVISFFRSIPDSFYDNALKFTKIWCEKSDSQAPQIYLWLFFNMRGGVHVFDQNIYADITFFMDQDGHVDQDMFFRSISSCFYSILMDDPPRQFREHFRYSDLPDSSKKKMLYYFIDKILVNGLVESICKNLPSSIAKRSFFDKSSHHWGNKSIQNTWGIFSKNKKEIFQFANNEILDILNGKLANIEELKSVLKDYWYPESGQTAPGKYFSVGRIDYLGSEMVTVIYDALGKDGLQEILENPFNLVPLFNRAIKKIRPDEYDKYIFSEKAVSEMVKQADENSGIKGEML